jgi:N-acetylglucosaminyl-diphospho-decaprenol L-rhamnosyltransferase
MPGAGGGAEAAGRVAPEVTAHLGAARPRVATNRVAGVVVDYDSGEALVACVRSLLAEGVRQVIVVENGDPSGCTTTLGAAELEVPVVAPGRNVGYGAGANRGLAASEPTEFVLVCNPDLRVHRGAVAELVATLDAEPAWAIVGPRILTPEGDPYPSVRDFPSMRDAAGHALLGLWLPDNPFTRRYRPPPAGWTGSSPAGPTGSPAAGPAGSAHVRAGWVSGACFLARRFALEELGGFDESYFMFAEDMDLCWRAKEAGWGVGAQPAAVVTHTEGVSRRRHPYRMILAHHRSALLFASRTARGWRRAALPLAAAVLGMRLVMATFAEARRADGAAVP